MRKSISLFAMTAIIALNSFLYLAPTRASEVVPFSSYICQGPEVVLLDNSNGGMVGNGGTAPSFSTNGKVYCLHGIETYHWNDGKGDTPGHLWLKRVSGPDGLPAQTSFFAALGSPGQNNVANANSYVNIPNNTKVIIDGTYLCEDTVKTSWASDTQSGGNGFCHVKAVLAVPPAAAGATPTSGTSAISTPISATGISTKEAKSKSPLTPMAVGAAVLVAAGLILYRRFKGTSKYAFDPSVKLPDLNEPKYKPTVSTPVVAEAKPELYEPTGALGTVFGKPEVTFKFGTEAGEPAFFDAVDQVEDEKSGKKSLQHFIEEMNKNRNESKPNPAPKTEVPKPPEEEIPQVTGDGEIVDGEYM